ncbi:MAG: hypothetical protein OIN86_07005 [Candidatus Methanoperedens sp.]|nr:hypothetical protein [Candidatus Methanoperedens sp.]CAG0959705.1 hypothetical protein METP1_00647 [Methanosarcinales archaeon]
MSFVERIRNNLEGMLRIEDGNCGTTHKVLREISRLGGKAIAWERPDGVYSVILDDKGKVVGEGEGITWPPAILFAMVEGGFFPEEIESQLIKSLQCIIDMEKVAEIYGYGRVVTPVASAYNEVWKNGGRVAIRRNSWGVEVVFIDKNDKEMAVGPISYCPTCGTAATIPRAPALAAKIKDELKDKKNTGKDKYERGMENHFFFKNDRVCCEIIEKGQMLGRALRCCIAYAGVAAEVHAGIAGPKWGALFKEYCRICPTKLCRKGKNTGEEANNLLVSLEKRDMKTDVRMDTYITAMVKKDGMPVGEGIGTVCAFSSLMYAAAKCIQLRSEIEVERV